jgi:hypothetical protein
MIVLVAKVPRSAPEIATPSLFSVGRADTHESNSTNPNLFSAGVGVRAFTSANDRGEL